jgi:catechol 2,3-dioxygenase-like lactoylglutathione lyase family enzyme
MLTDYWDISHICIAVPDLDAAMTMYRKAFGVRSWGPLIDFTDDHMEVVSPLLGSAASMRGLREVGAKDGSDIVTGGPPFAALELAEAAPFSPAASIWGCPGGRHYVHHLCFWVDDIEAESAHLVEHGFALELTRTPGPAVRGFGYHLSPTGMRVELMGRDAKAPHATWLKTGVMTREWA